MEQVEVNGKTFRISIPEAEIKKRVKAVAEEISRDLEGKNQIGRAHV